MKKRSNIKKSNTQSYYFQRSYSTSNIILNRYKTLLVVALPLVAGALLIGSFYISQNTSKQVRAATSTTIGAGKVGYNANVAGLHTPATLKKYSGNLFTSQDGQQINNLDVSGKIVVRHSNVTIKNVRTLQIHVDTKKYNNASANIEWATIGSASGLRIAKYDHAVVGFGNMRLYRSEVFGGVDLVHLSCGSSTIEQNWFHDLFVEPKDPTQGNGPSHADPIQFVPTFNCQSNYRLVNNTIRNNRFDVWTFGPGQKAKSNWGKLNSTPATSGLALVATPRTPASPAPENTKIISNYVDGNYEHALYAITESGASSDKVPRPLTIFDNAFKKRYTNYGKVKYGSVNAPYPGFPTAIQHFNNVDADTGKTIYLGCADGIPCVSQ